jgi:hypothetical protein
MKTREGPRADKRLHDPEFVASLRRRIGHEPIYRIALDLGVTNGTVRNWARRFSIALPRAGRFRVTPEPRGLQILGLSFRDPLVAESLRLLLHREQYSYTDVAMMFGVSRERVRQWTNALGIMYVAEVRWQHGLSATRLWDDERNCFVPVPNKVLREQQRNSQRLRRRTNRVSTTWTRRQEIIARAEQLRGELGREPSLAELVRAMFGNSWSAPELYRRWFGRDATRKGRAAEFKQGLAGVVGWTLRDGRRDKLRLSMTPEGCARSVIAEHRRVQTRATIVDVARALEGTLGRRPTLNEIACAFFGTSQKPSVQKLVRRWCGSTNAGQHARLRTELYEALAWGSPPAKRLRQDGRTARVRRSGVVEALQDLHDWAAARTETVRSDDLLKELEGRLSALKQK